MNTALKARFEETEYYSDIVALTPAERDRGYEGAGRYAVAVNPCTGEILEMTTRDLDVPGDTEELRAKHPGVRFHKPAAHVYLAEGSCSQLMNWCEVLGSAESIYQFIENLDGELDEVQAGAVIDAWEELGFVWREGCSSLEDLASGLGMPDMPEVDHEEFTLLCLDNKSFTAPWAEIYLIKLTPAELKAWALEQEEEE